jgi:hypothetical protein
MVPRLLNKLYDRVKGEIDNSKAKSYLFKKAIESKEHDRKRFPHFHLLLNKHEFPFNISTKGA